MKPFVSVIIPCRNEARFLGRCLDSLLKGDYPGGRMEILVVDGGSSDGTRELIATYRHRDARVRLVENPQGVTPWGLNHGIDAAVGDIIARVDAHASVAVDYLSLCVEHLEASGADNVGGSMRTLPQQEGLFAGPIVAALSHRFGVGNSYFRIGSGKPRWVDTVFGGCWRRQVFDSVGRFNTQLIRSQDMEFSLRLRAQGGKTLLVPEIRSDYYARAGLGSFWRHNVLNGRWAILPFALSEIVPVSLRHLIPLAFVLGLSAGLLFLSLTPWLLAAIALPYLAANLLASLDVARRERKWSYLASMPIVFLTLHLGYGLGSLSGVLEAAATIRGAALARSKENACIPQL
jgi:glycosyltransferase involved in cell wall biosynthesis